MRGRSGARKGLLGRGETSLSLLDEKPRRREASFFRVVDRRTIMLRVATAAITVLTEPFYQYFLNGKHGNVSNRLGTQNSAIWNPADDASCDGFPRNIAAWHNFDSWCDRFAT